MKGIVVLSALALMVCSPAAHTQEDMSTTRIEAQHKSTRSMEKHLAEYEKNLVANITDTNVTIQAQAVQTIRELEQMFPRYSFKSSLAPLEAKLKDEKADPIVRRLSALALDELHSDAGDAVIKDVAGFSEDKGLQTLCKALLVRSQNK